MGKIILGIILTLMVLGLLPFALIARSRASQSAALPPHLVLDMDKQPKFKAQRGTPLFADERSMRPHIEGTIAQEDMGIKSEVLNDVQTPGLILNLGGKDALQFPDATAFSAIMLGRVRPANMTDKAFADVPEPKASANTPLDEAIAADTTFYIKKIPAQFTVSPEFLQRGQERFNIYCAPCHGEDGYGHGPVAQRAAALRVVPNEIKGWADPQNLNEAKILARPDGHIFNTITNGIRNMPAYDKQISVADRWAIIAYVRALELSQNAPATPWELKTIGAQPMTIWSDALAHAHVPTLQAEKLNIGPVAGRLGIPAFFVGAVALIVVASQGFKTEAMTNHFFHSYLAAYSFFMAITLGGLAFVLIHHLARAGWSVTVRRVAEGLSLNVFLMAILIVPFFIPVGPSHETGVERMLHWFNPEVVKADEVLTAKSGYLNRPFFAIRMAIYFLIWMGMAWFFSSSSTRQDQTGDRRISLKMEKVAMPGIILFAFSLTAFIFDWVMSLNAHWFSTIFGVYYFAGCFLSANAAIVLIMLTLQKRGLIGRVVNHEHYHDLGKWMFAFTFFWGYIAFSQYMLIWYANLPEETQFYIPRQIGHWGSITIVLLFVHLLIPFPGLLSRHVKRSNAIIAFWAVWVLCALAIDQYWLVVPNQWINQIPATVSPARPNMALQAALPLLIDRTNPANATHHIYTITGAHEGFMDTINYPLQPKSVLVTVLCFFGVGGLYIFSTMLALKNKSLVPTKDPRLDESLAFQNI